MRLADLPRPLPLPPLRPPLPPPLLLVSSAVAAANPGQAGPGAGARTQGTLHAVLKMSDSCALYCPRAHTQSHVHSSGSKSEVGNNSDRYPGMSGTWILSKAEGTCFCFLAGSPECVRLFLSVACAPVFSSLDLTPVPLISACQVDQFGFEFTWRWLRMSQVWLKYQTVYVVIHSRVSCSEQQVVQVCVLTPGG